MAVVKQELQGEKLHVFHVWNEYQKFQTLENPQHVFQCNYIHKVILLCTRDIYIILICKNQTMH